MKTNHSHLNGHSHSQSNNGHAQRLTAAHVAADAPADPVQQQASEAISNLARMKSELGSKQLLSPRARKFASSFMRVKPAFITECSVVAQSHNLTGFDADAASEALAYESTLKPVIAVLRGTLRALEDSVLAKHQPVAEQALAVYASVKGLARFNDPAVQTQIDELAKLLSPPRKRKPKANPTASPASTDAGTPAK